MKKLYSSSLVKYGVLIERTTSIITSSFFTPKFNFMQMFTLRIFMFLSLGIISVNTIGQTLTTGGTYTQNFDGIGDAANATLPSGWKADINSGVMTVGNYNIAQTTTSRRAGANMNSANSSGIYNFGAGTTTQGNGDRAIGGVTGSTSDKSINVYFKLTVSNTLPGVYSDGVNVSYSIEKYRNGSNPDGYSVRLYYSNDGVTWSLAPVAQTNFLADANENGFSPAPDATQTRSVTAQVPLTLAVGASSQLYLAWNISTTSTTATSAPAKSMAIAIDDVRLRGAAEAAIIPPPAYFRSINNGNWDNTVSGNSALTTWESSLNNSPGSWSPANRGPNRNDYSIIIQSGNTVNVTSDQTADQLFVDGTLRIDAASLSIYDGVGFDLNVSGLVNNMAGKLIIISEKTGQSDIGTASVGPVTGSITGNVTVERYISAKSPRSAWRLMAAPLSTGNAVSDKIRDNWQTMGSGALTGMTVSGPNNTPAAVGFDYTTPQYSMKTWNAATQSFVPVTNTLTTSLYNPNGYFTFIRGDRSVTPFGAGETKLSAIGFLKTGSFSVATSSANDAFTMVGNPYASAVDLLTFSMDNSGSNTKSTYYYWDPYQTGVYGVGGFVTVSFDVNNNVTITPESNATMGDETRFLQSGQAMFVQTRSTGQGGAASVTFNESQKSYNVANNIFRTQGNVVDNLRVNLNVLSSGSAILLDGIVAAFNPSYAAGIDNYDAHKIMNIGESISFMTKGIALSVDRRAEINSNDVLNINLTSLKPNVTYQLQVKPSLSVTGLNAFLVDNYLKSSTPIDLTKGTTVDFTINSDAASTGANRFVISFAKPLVVTAGKQGISVFPNPVSNGVINLQMKNMAAGVYNVRVFNNLGQAVVNQQINHSAGNNTQVIRLGNAPKGIYQLDVVKPDNSKLSLKIVAN